MNSDNPLSGFEPTVVVGMARRASVYRAGRPTSSCRPPFRTSLDGTEALVSLRELKALVQGLEPADSLRILILGEPDEVPRREYASKIVSWYRLILTRADSALPDGH